MNQPPKDLSSFKSLVEIMNILRSKNGCPWDKEQNSKTLIPYAMEEVCELIDAIESEEVENIKEELGDVLLQVVFHAQIANENKQFDIMDVIEGINKKLVSRHPHVFGNVQVQSAKEVLKNWNEIKSQEKKTSPFEVPKALPSLQRAQKIGNKTKKLNFDWENAQHAFEHVESEILEFKEAIENNDKENLQEELGDLLFTIVQVARHLEIDAESALRNTNSKVETRWLKMKELAQKRKLEFEKLKTEDLEKLWSDVKKQV